ncbi:hypothetical protein [Paenibacillus terrigena]|uniref:hypothetical protein n=1 Tax=Paenibacillus terrigena TaxID=369333 RepID=UPI0028D6AC51|nr:hypothetical protein [Paenibacillus terrigena]
MPPTPPSTQATFYQYTLIQKVVYNKLVLKFYLAIVPIVLLLETLLSGPLGLLYSAIALFFVLWIHFVVIRSVLLLAGEPIRKKWRFRRVLPWIGFLPDQYIGYRIFIRVHRHLAWLGLCVCLILYPWFPISFVTSSLIWHLWLIIPRQFLFTRFRKQPKHGLFKLTDTEMLYYKA